MFSIVSNLPALSAAKRSHAYLVNDRWDDWGKFATMFAAHLIDEVGERHELGSVKIGHAGLRSGPAGTTAANTRRPALPQTFDSLDHNYFSLGQTETYYEALSGVSPDLRIKYLRGLRDCAYDLEIFKQNLMEEVMVESLLRDVSEINVSKRFHRLAHGDATLTKFQFQYDFPDVPEVGQVPTLAFAVRPFSVPPTNVHVLIGRNGVGKTRTIQRMASALLSENQLADCGRFTRLGDNADEWSFAGLVWISFSAFDEFDLPPTRNGRMHATQVGLRGRRETGEGTLEAYLKPRAELTRDFLRALESCRSGPRASRLAAALETLESDPIFAEVNAKALLTTNHDDWGRQAASLFGSLSSGHAVVLLAITKLVELVDEKTFVIIDEPETHLHPPLLSALLRAISDLLIKRNGVALIATHSPVVLQEVPRSCVWKLWRSGSESAVERPHIETFAENVGTLTREVFRLEVTESGFHSLIVRHAAERRDDSQSLSELSEALGSEGRLIAAVLKNRER